MKHFTSTILALFIAAFATATSADAQQLSERDVQKGLEQMRAYKHTVLTRELDLTKDQQQKFFDVYDAMDNELMALGDETREIERKTSADANATDAECTEAARKIFEQKKREGEIELKYFDSFAQILTARQLLKLKSAERKIALGLAKYHGRADKKRTTR